ncbi:MAG: MFS transporter [Merismopedia sp. SIO2A8]|nr:MFS transporter [Merismopedia sp. SIO2A8]
MTIEQVSTTECYSRKRWISAFREVWRPFSQPKVVPQKDSHNPFILFISMGSLRTKLARQLARQQSTPVTNRFLKLCVLVAAGCLTTMTGTVIAPIFPEMLEQLQLEPAWAATLAVSVHEMAIALFTPIMGLLADRIGKLNILLPGLVCYAVLGLLAPL